MTAVEVCLICDIAECRHIREQKAKMTRPTDEELNALVFDLDHAHPDNIDYRAWTAAITDLRAQLAEVRAERAFTVSDGQRMLRKQDIITVCDTPDLCFESDDGVARCGQCAKKLAERDGITLNQYTVSNPGAMRLRRELAAANARADRAEAALAAQIETDDIPPFHFYRYINGVLMAEGVEINKETTLDSAMKVASRIASKGPNGEAPVLVYRNQQRAGTAFDRMLRTEREKALREAYDSLFKHPGFIHAISGQKFKAVKLEDAAEGILALIEKPNAHHPVKCLPES